MFFKKNIFTFNFKKEAVYLKNKTNKLNNSNASCKMHSEATDGGALSWGFDCFIVLIFITKLL